ncbi:hypothetical protein GLOTRDRAFT_103219 [Gloeophyllum trabeum ATCC 11539]|uniref:RING-type domain-containing protein n=1 Tax=Gloeophyllum trabeum (strain ATCC 11539 / FP-39264 / Madison 617) TaxID=670483 RepID=S7QH90_GLOTA|nr:uncharacterized protein GLOTRDRAFT_103219 [Gloeophyllum trabeum ATCC 11539]EPQ59171.1 hypothetical protein GLOTRDRAFT_103219 [Gloeophyllum trabeum ATCC 11539]
MLAETESISSLSPPPEEVAASPVKRYAEAKRAQTKPCPVCDEVIPVRLLGAHAVLELQRVEDILGNMSSMEAVEVNEEGLDSRSRRSFLKARKSLSALSSAPSTSTTDILVQTTKTLHTIMKRRKQRHTKLREMTREEEDSHFSRRTTGRGEGVCPVCLQVIKGDPDVVEAHVDSCLAHANRVLEETQREERRRARVGAGFSTLDRNQQDVDEDIDVDGDDAGVFGDAQFTEGDVLGESLEVDVEAHDEADGEGTHERKTLRALVAEGKVVRRLATGSTGVDGLKAEMEEVMGVGETDLMDLAITLARKKGDASALVVALENKVKQLESMRVSSSTTLLCRICLDPYTEPTVSTGCWHTCCRECWLRCLGSTKLCPMCKRITAATELRRVYL